jgi:predicted ATP-binding protein involved in virulence
MRIEKIEFNGFKADDRIATVDMSAKNVTVIFGDNGCGKTTFLKAINSFLSQDDEALLAIGIRSINCDVQDDDKEIRVSVVLSEHGYDWTSFDESPLSNSKSLSLGVERGISTQSMKVEPDVLIDFLCTLNGRANFLLEKEVLAIPAK